MPDRCQSPRLWPLITATARLNQIARNTRLLYALQWTWHCLIVSAAASLARDSYGVGCVCRAVALPAGAVLPYCREAYGVGPPQQLCRCAALLPGKVLGVGMP